MNYGITAVARSAAGAEFEFATQAERNYRLEGTEDLASGQWAVLLDNIPGTGAPLQVRDPNATTLKQYFYRILLLP